MKTVRGDLIALARSGSFDVIVHGCNCFCAMGNGIAGQIKVQLPQAFQADLATKKGDRSKLGTCSTATIGPLTVVNAYTQFTWSKKGQQVADYAAIASCFRFVKERFAGQRIGLPKIGAGLAGGDWATIATLIDRELEGEDVTLVEYRPG
jgi:O-acetyl-ADP-ribose deacetylase (regulator of RNase III)